MKNDTSNYMKYLTISPIDEEWGLVTTTVGKQFISSQSTYPVQKHPSAYLFNSQTGRVLYEYQLIYIHAGQGYFESANVKRQLVKAGTVILLFPGEWHSYSPDPNTGWEEYWIGFKGKNMDEKVEKQFFSSKEPLLQIGVSDEIVTIYEECMEKVEQEKNGYQQFVSSLAQHLLGMVYYRKKNFRLQPNHEDTIIHTACQLIKERINHRLSPEDVAKELGISYSWFRQHFKRVTGVSPTQYLIQQLIRKAKELLACKNNSISDVAFLLGFEEVGQFSTLFKKKAGITPGMFRKGVGH